MKQYQQDFIRLSVDENVLKFGEFTLKSGRKSPYFFNAGLFNTGATLSSLGRFYAAAIEDFDVEFDVLFGPAYKGIPLVASTAVALNDLYGKSIPYSFNRKEAKDHGEGGVIVGAALKGKRVLIIDDVITAGTAIREAVAIIKQAGGEPVGIVTALDRQERGQDERSAVQEVRAELGLAVTSIVRLEEIVQYLSQQPAGTDEALLTAMRAYKATYGAPDQQSL